MNNTKSKDQILEQRKLGLPLYNRLIECFNNYTDYSDKENYSLEVVDAIANKTYNIIVIDGNVTSVKEKA